MSFDRQTAFRFPAALMDRLDASVARYAVEVGIAISRSDLVRLLLERGLDDLEKRLLEPRDAKGKAAP